MKKTRERIRRVKKISLVISLVLILALVFSGCTTAGDTSGDGVLSGILGEQTRSESVNILLLLTLLSLLPSLLIMLTGFTRIIIVLSLIRNGIGLQNMPPNQVLIGLALFLTLFVMTPVVNEITTTAYEPYVREEITLDEAVERATEPVRNFMLAQTKTNDLEFFMAAAENSTGEPLNIENYEDIPMTAVIPAFITSEITRGFQIGFYLYIPFIVIDMVVASTLMSMGMMMLPPMTISLPFKLLLFVLVEGWSLTIQSLLTSFG